jgi:hypothetical protein
VALTFYCVDILPMQSSLSGGKQFVAEKVEAPIWKSDLFPHSIKAPKMSKMNT